MITPIILQEFKDRMHLGDDEDGNLLSILSASEVVLKKSCGSDYNIEIDEEFKELVFERSRYAYEGALEYFDKNFQSRINSLGLNKALDAIVLEDDPNATV